MTDTIFYQLSLDKSDFYVELIDCALIPDKYDKPPCILEWKEGKLIWTWRHITGTEEWVTPLKDIDCWCWRKQKWKCILNNKALPGMVDAIVPENRMCIVRSNRFHHQNDLVCWDPKDGFWTYSPIFWWADEMEDYDETIHIWCRVSCGCKTWRWLFYDILDEEDKVLFRWSGVLRENE